MTYQQPSPTHDADADEASSLLLTVAGGGGVPATKKKHGVPTMRAMIVMICFLLGTLAVLYYGGRATSSGGISAALLRVGTCPGVDMPYDPTDHLITQCYELTCPPKKPTKCRHFLYAKCYCQKL